MSIVVVALLCVVKLTNAETANIDDTDCASSPILLDIKSRLSNTTCSSPLCMQTSVGQKDCNQDPKQSFPFPRTYNITLDGQSNAFGNRTQKFLSTCDITDVKLSCNDHDRDIDRIDCKLESQLVTRTTTHVGINCYIYSEVDKEVKEVKETEDEDSNPNSAIYAVCAFVCFVILLGCAGWCMNNSSQPTPSVSYVRG